LPGPSKGYCKILQVSLAHWRAKSAFMALTAAHTCNATLLFDTVTFTLNPFAMFWMTIRVSSCRAGSRCALWAFIVSNVSLFFSNIIVLSSISSADGFRSRELTMDKMPQSDHLVYPLESLTAMY
jgi:hypothetical protein